jgi:hypothetical protein
MHRAGAMHYRASAGSTADAVTNVFNQTAMNTKGSFVISSMPDYSELLANAEANVARVSDAVKLTHLQTLADTSDERYFRALMESTMRHHRSPPGQAAAAHERHMASRHVLRV